MYICMYDMVLKASFFKAEHYNQVHIMKVIQVTALVN